MIYELDRRIEGLLEDSLRSGLEGLGRFVVIAEGLGESEQITVPDGIDPASADAVIIIDPIDGTRGLMYGKRSAWILTGVAFKGLREARLEDIEIAVQTEIPTPRSRLADQLWAGRGQGTRALTRDLENRSDQSFTPQPSTALSVRGGFAGLTRFFPPGRELLARIDDELMRRILGSADSAPAVFEDQYLSTGGQLYEIMTGKDRFIADLRPEVFDDLRSRGQAGGHAAHPYDLCCFLIAREAGAIVTAPDGGPLDYPLDTTTPVSWAAYANTAIRSEIEPVLRELIEEWL